MTGVQYQIDYEIGQTLSQRSEVLANVEGLGPPDLCYLTYKSVHSGLKKLFSFGKAHSRFHYVYGNKTDIGSLSAYFAQFDNVSSLSLSGAHYCIYDIFSKSDFRVEASIPGAVSQYVLSASRVEEPSEIIIKGAYISSVLRYFYAQPLSPCRYLNPISSNRDLKFLIETASQFRHRIAFFIGDTADTLRYAEHLTFYAISRYLLDNGLFKIHQIYFEKLSQKDPLMLLFLSDGCLKSKQNTKFVRQMIEAQLTNGPKFVLEHALGKILMNNYELSEAEGVFKNMIVRQVNNVTVWIHVLKIYVQKQDFDKAIMGVNAVPYTKTERESVELFNVKENLPEVQGILLNSSHYFWLKPQKLDFDRTVKNKRIHPRNFEIKKKLLTLPANLFDKQKLRIYDILIQILTLRDWNYILNKRKELFGVEDKSLRIQGIQILKSVDHRRTASETVSVEKFSRSNHQVMIEHIECPDSISISSSVEASTSHSYEEVLSSLKRIENPLLGELIQALHEDLEALVDWHHESNETDLSEVNRGKHLPYTGKVYLLRGLVSERLKKMRLAERAYRYAIEKGFSMYAWYRLMKMYTKTCSPKSMLTCVFEIIKHATKKGMMFSDQLPEWIEKNLCKLCSGCGYTQLWHTAEELNCKRFPVIVKSLKRMRRWKVDGC